MNDLVILRLAIVCASVALTESVPNIIVMMADDLGYGDLYSYDDTTGQEKNEIDVMAEEGIRFTQWTAGGPMCTPSRAALLTGRYAFRSGIYGSASQVFAPKSRGGLRNNTTTIAEALKAQGYATGMIGKWHLGINEVAEGDGNHLPKHHGFDWVGTNLPHGQSSTCDPSSKTAAEMTKHCFLYNGSSIVQQPIDLKVLSQKLRDDAITFINANRNGPFFLYLALPQVHNAYFCNDNFCGKSNRDSDGYGDFINEMAWIVGGVLAELKSLEIQNDTLAVFTSDQGASQDSCRSSHTNGGFRGGKGSTWEGAFRVPAVAWWPKTLSANTVSNTLVNHMDIFPTAVKLAGGSSYLNSLTDALDGQFIPDIISRAAERESFFYYCSDRLMAVRYKNYKAHYHTMGDIVVPSGRCKSNQGDFGCYGANITSHSTPVLYDLNSADGKTETTQYSGSDKDTIIAEITTLVNAHNSSLVIPASEIDKQGGSKLIPCCNNSDCICNYP